MSDTLVGVDTSALLADVHAAVDGLLDVDTALATEDGLLELLRETERLRNRIAALDHAVILEVETRGVPQAHAACSTSNFLTQLLRLHPLEASARARAAQSMGSRRALSGEPLEPLFPRVAAGQAAGVVSPRHASIIVNTVSNLAPENVEEGAGVEKARAWRRRWSPSAPPSPRNCCPRSASATCSTSAVTARPPATWTISSANGTSSSGSVTTAPAPAGSPSLPS